MQLTDPIELPIDPSQLKRQLEQTQFQSPVYQPIVIVEQVMVMPPMMPPGMPPMQWNPVFGNPYLNGGNPFAADPFAGMPNLPAPDPFAGNPYYQGGQPPGTVQPIGPQFPPGQFQPVGPGQWPGYPQPTAPGQGPGYAQPPAAAPIPSSDPSSVQQQYLRAVQTLRDHYEELRTGDFFGFGGDISGETLQAAALGQKGGPDVQAAAQFILAHPDLRNQLDTASDGGNPDGHISGDDLNAQVAQLNRASVMDPLLLDGRLPKFQESVSTLATYFSQVDNASGSIFGPDGIVGWDDLNAVINNPASDPRLRDAAIFLTGNRDLFTSIDAMADGGATDGKIGANDVSAMLTKLNLLRSSQPTLSVSPTGGTRC